MQQPDIRDLVPIDGVWTRLSDVETRLLEVTESDDAFLTKIARHLLTAGGKRFRPLLAQVTAEFGSIADGRPVEAGVAVELIHVGSLYHDDVIDEADTRRGGGSANALWSNTLAILAGDFVLARASEVAAASLGQAGVVLLAQTYARLCEGQVLELQLTGDVSQSIDDYYKVIEAKTASLIRTAARLGTMAADAPPSIVEAASTWAFEVGVAFQLVDDVLDLVASSDFLGKPAGSDIAEGKFTLAVLEALRGTGGDKLAAFLDGGPPYPAETVDRVIAAVREQGYIDLAVDVAEARLRRADRALGDLPPGVARDTLARLGRYLVGQVDLARASS